MKISFSHILNDFLVDEPCLSLELNGGLGIILNLIDRFAPFLADLRVNEFNSRPGNIDR